jgi:DtxR family Mn-dependent transcriptional regulator
MYSQIEENYLKAIFKLSIESEEKISTSAIARELDIQSASVTDMVKRLAHKKLIHYKRYQGVSLTGKGRKIAVDIIRKHRLWEVFLLEKLHFRWSEIHDLAEQLEHIQSDELINRLDDFLGNPSVDPHGGPIPDREGNISRVPRKLLVHLEEGTYARIAGVKDDTRELLEFLEKIQLFIGTELIVLQRFNFDQSIQLGVDGKKLIVSGKVAENLWMTPLENQPD